MTAIALINGLAGLLIVTSLVVIEARRLLASAVGYAAQSFVLVLIFVALGAATGAHQLYLWAGTAIVTKVVMVPAIMYWMLGKRDDPTLAPQRLGTVWSILLAGVNVAICFAVVSAVHLPIAAALKPALAVSLAHFVLGLACIVLQRNLLKQVFGFCLMENGSHLTLALMANQAPEVVEIGIATDAIFAVVIMAVIGARIHSTLHTLDIRQLTSLRG